MPQPHPVSDRVWTVPNVLSFVRLAFVPVFFWLTRLVGERRRRVTTLFAAGPGGHEGWDVVRLGLENLRHPGRLGAGGDGIGGKLDGRWRNC